MRYISLAILTVNLALVAGCASTPTGPNYTEMSYRDLQRLAGERKINRENGLITSVIYTDYKAVAQLCDNATLVSEISFYCLPFNLGSLTTNPTFSQQKEKYLSYMVPSDKSLMLARALKVNDLALARVAIEQGADVNKAWPRSVVENRSYSGPAYTSPFYIAYSNKNVDQLKLLINSGVDMQKPPDGETRLYHHLLSGDERDSQSLDLILKNGYEISQEEVGDIEQISSSCEEEGDKDSKCGLRDVLKKSLDTHAMLVVAINNRTNAKIRVMEARAKENFERAGLTYIPLDEQKNISRNPGMKVCFSDGNIGAFGFVEQVTSQKVKVSVAGFFPKHITSLNVDGMHVGKGMVLWGNISDWMVCEALH